MSYTHLTISEQAEIYKLRETDKLSVIIATMKRSKSTILRGLNRNTREEYKVYLPDTADATVRQRKAKVKGRFKRIADLKTEIGH